MKSLLVAATVVVLSSASAMADCCTGNTCYGCMTSLGTFTIVDPPQCDGNDKTPDEAVQCKLDYWRKEVTRRIKARDDAQSALDKANDRVRAFEQAAKH